MSATPRVLQVVLSLNPGGTERLVVELAARLHAEMPTAVCCLDDAGAWADELRSRAIEVSALKRRPGFRPMLGGRVAAAARRHGANVVHAHHYSPFVYSALARLWPSGPPVVFTEHGRLSDAPPSTKRRLANRVLSRLPHRVVTVSEDLRQHLLAEGFAEGAVSVIYNGVDVGPTPSADDRRAVRHELGVPDDTLVVGTVARLDPVKDLTTLIRALSHEFDRPVRIVIVGDGPERSHLETVAADLGFTSGVTFLGQRPDVRRLMAGFDIYVNCSISEGISLTILEAMAAALPIIATRVGGTPEVLDASCGLLIPPRDPGALAGALRLLAADADGRQQLGHAARLRFEQRFTLDRMVREYRELYLDARLSARA